MVIKAVATQLVSANYWCVMDIEKWCISTLDNIKNGFFNLHAKFQLRIQMF